MILLTYFGYFGHKLTLDGIFGGIFAGMWDGDGIPELAGGMRMGFGRKWTVAGWDWDLILEKSDTSRCMQFINQCRGLKTTVF